MTVFSLRFNGILNFYLNFWQPVFISAQNNLNSMGIRESDKSDCYRNRCKHGPRYVQRDDRPGSFKAHC